jgi:predicted nucleic acid-binding Zn ribbon protein
MPTYERKCPHCGHEWEQEETIDGQLLSYTKRRRTLPTMHPVTIFTKDASVCPICGNATRRLISKTNFVLRGPGWARDGYSK